MLTTAMRPVRCRAIGCQNMLMRRTINHRACSVECAKVLVDIKNAKEAARMAKVERASIKARKEKIKTRSDLIKEVQVAFNRFIRLRDAGLPCICCGREGDSSATVGGGAFDCGHYRSTGSAPHMRFNEDNAHAQLKQCNRYGAGRAVDYRIGLIGRIGLERVEALEDNNDLAKWTADELREMRETYRAKARELEKK